MTYQAISAGFKNDLCILDRSRMAERYQTMFVRRINHSCLQFQRCDRD